MREEPYKEVDHAEHSDNRRLLEDFREYLRSKRDGKSHKDSENMRFKKHKDNDRYAHTRHNRKHYDEEDILNMLYGADYNDDENSFDKHEAMEIVEDMFHIKGDKRFVGEKYDIIKANEVCNRYKEIIPHETEVEDVYIAINAQYHDYCCLFEGWFGSNIDNKIFESAIIFWFKDPDFEGDKVWKYFNM